MTARKRDRDPELIQALAIGHTWRNAAKIAGVSESLVTRRMQDPEFRAKVDTERAERRQRIAATLDHAAEAAVACLIRECRGSGPSAVAAARAILSERFRLVESLEVRAMLEGIEDADDPPPLRGVS